MKKAVLIFALLSSLGLLAIGAHAQTETPSLKTSTWKAYIDQLNDSITLHIRNDSSFVTTSNGDVVVRSICKISSDTLLLTDYGGQYACLGVTGKYKVSIDNDVMTMVLVEDPCESRAGSINNLKWKRSAPTAPPMTK